MNPAGRRSFAAALLAGGRSARMGADKALLEWHGAPLWRVQLGKLIELNPDRLLLSCREEQRLKSVFAEFVPDPPGNPGPLAAVVRCLEAARLPLLVLAVDMPRVTCAFLRSLLGECGEGHVGVVCRARDGLDPLCAVYPPGAVEPLRALLRDGELRMRAAAERLVGAGLMRARDLRSDEVPLFLNLNTPEDYAWTRPAPNGSS